MIKTYDMHILYIDGTVKHYTNLSRVAVKHYKDYFNSGKSDWPYVNMIVVKRSLTSH